MKNKIMILGACFGVIVGVFAPIAEAVVGEVGSAVVYAAESDEAGELDGLEGPGESEESEESGSKLYIKAVNPGYKIDGVNNVGEMIEIVREGELDTPFLLAGAAVGYTNSSGKRTLLYEFPENSWMTGESILLRLASSPGHELAAVNYNKTLAMNGAIDLSVDGRVVDEVCWTGKKDCYKAFSSAKPTTLVRNIETGDFEHLSFYQPEYDAGAYMVEKNEEAEDSEQVKHSRCRGVRFSEVLSYYETTKSEQFIELYNSGSGQVGLDGCELRYKNKKYSLSGTMEAEGYYAYYPAAFSLTKNPTNSNKIDLVDADGAILDTLEYLNGQRKGTAYAFLGNDEKGEEIWKTTYAPTPGEPNNYQEFKTCEAGKVINKVTGNCVKVTSVADKVCKEGYHLNILTGRCKKDAVAKDKVCKEGYYLNPETNRCRKIQENKGADYSLQPENYEENSAFVAWYAVLGVLAVGAGYLIYEFRGEIAKLWRKVFRRSH